MATTLEQVAAERGYPSSLFGFTPADKEYWREPGLPWFMAEMYENPPLSYRGFASTPHFGDIETDSMAPRFPRGCAVNTMPVYERKNLVIGRVYTYRFKDQVTGEWEWTIARLVKIGGNHLEVKADNDPLPSLWLLRDNEQEAVWDVQEVTHYASYPGE